MRYRRIFALVCGLVLIFPLSVWIFHHLSWFTPDGNAIRKQVDASVYAYHSFDYPPAQYDRTLMPAAVIAAERTRAYGLARRLYTGRLLSFWLQTYRQIISPRSYASRLAYRLVWRVIAIEHNSLSLVPGSTDAQAEVVTVERSSLGQTSRWDDQFQLVRIGDTWKIESVGSSCLDGCP